MAGMKKTPQVYLFYGEESYLVQKMAASLVESLLEPSEREFNLTLLEADPTVGELLHLVESAPFFGERKVVVVKNSRLFQAPRRKASDVEDDEAERRRLAANAARLAAERYSREAYLARTREAYRRLVPTADEVGGGAPATAAAAPGTGS